MTRGFVSYRDYRVEYPPGALPVFVLPAIGHDQPTQYPGYRGIFVWMMVASGSVVIALMRLTLRMLGAPPKRLAAALAFAALAPLALGALVLSRFDLYAAVFTAAGLAALVAGRSRTGAAVLAVGAATKFYPALLLPLALIDVWRRHGRSEALRCAGIFSGVLATIIVPFVITSPGGMWWRLHRQLTRPLQSRSVGRVCAWAVHSGTPRTLRRCKRLRIRCPRESALAAVPHLARRSSPARPWSPHCHRLGTPRKFARRNAALVPASLLGSRPATRYPRIHARARPGRRTRRASGGAREAGRPAGRLAAQSRATRSTPPLAPSPTPEG